MLEADVQVPGTLCTRAPLLKQQPLQMIAYLSTLSFFPAHLQEARDPPQALALVRAKVNGVPLRRAGAHGNEVLVM